MTQNNSNNIYDHIAVIKYIMRTKGIGLNDAIDEADVPNELRKTITIHFAQEQSNDTAALVSELDESLAYCLDPENNQPGFIHGAFSRYLIENKEWEKSTVESLNKNTQLIVPRLPDPKKTTAHYTTKGLVIGHIQSGKTANMASLICKAADRGYKFFIILAGMHKDLRQQTQSRFDHEITGKCDNIETGDCVKHSPAAPKFIRLTHSGLNDDFKPATFSDISNETIKFAVVKKNVSVLSSLIKWLSSPDISLDLFPAMIIDDEADQATINANYGKKDEDGNDIDPTKTNKLIRKLVNLFPRCAYIGFTASPFANLLIDKDLEHDLYPKDFVISLSEPEGYYGPRQLFGLGLTSSELSPEDVESPTMDVIRSISREDQNEIDHMLQGRDTPSIIQRAINSFILASCARIERGHQSKHFSMFIHPSHTKNKQELMRDVVIDYIKLLQAYVRFGKHKYPVFFDDVRNLWEQDFCSVIDNDPELQANYKMSFDDVWKHAESIIDQIEVKLLNSDSDDELEYSSKKPKRYIIVGGNRLSRGLTLEGLSTSVFLRNTPYYDTLLQMGRWFGFRPRYADLTRIFVEDTIADHFADLARVELELREDIKKYADDPSKTPSDIAPLIRAHFALLPTSRNKQGAAKITQWWAGATKQTVVFPTGELLKIRKNIRVSEQLVSALKLPVVNEHGLVVWTDVPANVVMDYISRYQFADVRIMNSEMIIDCIKHMNDSSEVLLWDIVLASGPGDTFDWPGNLKSGKVLRTPTTRTSTSTSIGVLRSPSDISNWRKKCGRDEATTKHGALFIYVIDGENSKSSSKSFYNGDDKPDIIGLTLVFPPSTRPQPTSYITQ